MPRVQEPRGLAPSESILTDEGREVLSELRRVRDESLDSAAASHRQRRGELDELYQQTNQELCNNFRIQRDNVFQKYRR